jgi:hypothetical protein
MELGPHAPGIIPERDAPGIDATDQVPRRAGHANPRRTKRERQDGGAQPSIGSLEVYDPLGVRIGCIHDGGPPAAGAGEKNPES